jgi:hypothetical protein
MDAEVTVTFIIHNAFDEEDMDDDCFDPQGLVEDKLDQEGFSTYLDDLDSTFVVTNVKLIG